MLVLEFPDTRASFRKSKMGDEGHCIGVALRFCEQMSQVASTASLSCMIEISSLKAREEHVPLVPQSSSMPREKIDRVDEVGHFANGCAK